MAISGLTFSFKGRELLFFDELKKTLEELVCPICHEISFDPVQTSCGHLFCGKCLQDVTCPLCRQPYTAIPDHFNSRRIKGMKVGCPNVQCDWTGGIGDLEGHLHSCPREEIQCPNGCDEKFARTVLRNHTTNECPLRPVNCQYCPWKGKASTLFEHTTFCPLASVECPYQCQQSAVQRRHLEAHLETCPNRFVKCKYYPIGCRELIAADKMTDHVVQAKGDHLEKAMNKVVELSVAVGNLCRQVEFSTPFNPEGIIAQPWLENEKLVPICPFVIPMSAFSQKRQKVWFSPPCYTHAGGYKLCLKVHGNGFGDEKGKSLSVFLCLMKGENDDLLKWPMTEKVTFALVNQIEDSGHVTHSVAFAKYPKQNIRVLESTVADSGLGKRAFTPLGAIVEDLVEDKVQFLRNDCLFFKVYRL
jgi:TNF receptor-associated factor 4